MFIYNHTENMSAGLVDLNNITIYIVDKQYKNRRHILS